VTHARHLDTGADRDAFARQVFEHDRGKLRIVLGKRRCGLEHGHLRAEPPMRLRELEPDRTGAE
jgi:hypothetical protein